MRSFCRALGVPGGQIRRYAVFGVVRFHTALLWPCVPCIRAFDGPLIIPYGNNSSGVYGPFMRSVYALLCYGPIGAFMVL